MFLVNLLIGLMPLTDHPLWAKMAGGMTLFKGLGAVCLIYAVIHVWTRQAIPSFLGPWQARLTVALCTLATISYVVRDQPGAWYCVLSYICMLGLMITVVATVDSVRRLRSVLLTVVGSQAFASLYVLRDWQKYHNLYSSYRPGGVSGDSNYFALDAVFCMPIAFYLMVGRTSKLEKFFCMGSLAVVVVASALASSRGGFLGMVAAFLFLIWNSPRRGRNLALASALLVPLTLIVPGSPVRRLIHPNGGDKYGAHARTVVWKAGERMILTHPLLGVGIAGFKPSSVKYEDRNEDVSNLAHNTYIELTAELGMFGFIVFLGILYYSFDSLGRARKQAKASEKPFLARAALSIQAGLVGYAVGATFLSVEYEKTFWLMVFLSVSVKSMAARKRVEKEQPARAEGTAESFPYPLEVAHGR